MSGVNNKASTLIGGKHKRYEYEKANGPTWLYRGFASYDQTERLRNTLLVVKRISDCTLWIRAKACGYVLQEKDSADTQKPVCENMPLPSPATVPCKMGI